MPTVTAAEPRSDEDTPGVIPAAEVMGYVSAWSVVPGEPLDVMVSCTGADTYTATVVQLRQPDAGADTTPFRPAPVAVPLQPSYPARFQRSAPGSLGVVPNLVTDRDLTAVTMTAYVRPTLPGRRRQIVMGNWSEDDQLGCSIVIDAEGRMAVLVGNGSTTSIVSAGAFVPDRWYFVAASVDLAGGEVVLHQEPLDDRTFHPARPTYVTATAGPGLFPPQRPFWFAGRTLGSGERADLFDGRIERPRLACGLLTRDEMRRLDTDPALVADAVLAAWDFSRDIATDRLTDVGPGGCHGVAINQPTRGVPGHRWNGEQHDWRTAPLHYGAIHFHRDDLADAGWEADFSFRMPDDCRSGVFAVRLAAGGSEWWIPFAVRPGANQLTAPVALLLPTATYTAYQNHRGRFGSLAGERLYGRLNIVDANDLAFLGRTDLGLSTYDRHADGSGVIHAHPRRAAYNVRPTGRSWNFHTDLFIIDWLEHLSVGYDVITDEDLHREGVGLAARYQVILSGSHPEYASSAMLDAIEAYLRHGGRFMYMGGNGFYWRIAYRQDGSGAIEVRRPEGVRAWDAEPGSYHMSFTGERGGLWRHNGRAPQRLFGVGFVSQGFDRSSPYRLTPAARDPRVAWMFEGVTGDIIGDHGAVQGGAAGYEIDATDPALGTPGHALVVARSEGHSNTYEIAIEEVLVPHGATDGISSSDIRAEIAFFECPAGGAVFSVGSIAYAGALGSNEFNNDICRLTTNVLRRFIDPLPFTMP